MGRITTNADWLDQISEDMDLRKRRKDTLIDHIVRRAHWLEANDRELVMAMFRDGQSARAIAEQHDLCPRQTRRQIKKLIHRLSDPRVAYVIAHHDQWSKSRRSIAHALYIQGRSMRETTDELGLSFYSVRKHREEIDAMCLASLNNNKLRAWR